MFRFFIKSLLDYWMQNGKAALSLVKYNYKLQPTHKNISELLTPIFQKNGKNTKLSYSLFYPLYGNLKESEPNKEALAKFILNKKIISKPILSRACTYCGNSGANEVTSYIFPFITIIEKYPNAYSLGNKSKSTINFCSKCMLISFAAQSRWLFKVNTSQNTEFISSIMFFSTSENTLTKFYSNFITPNLLPHYFHNIKNLLKIQVWYSEELLALLIYFLSKKINQLKPLNLDLGALLFSYVSSGKHKTAIYDSFDIIDDLYPFIKSFHEFRNNTKVEDGFKILFTSLKKSKFSIDASDFLYRKRLFRTLFIFKKVDWKAIQELIVIKASENKTIPFLKSFIIVVANQLLLSSEPEIFDTSYRVGHKVGKLLREKNQNKFNRNKKFIFDFRRCRSLSQFLLLLNQLQTQVETSLEAESFVSTNNKYFETAKAGFLLGFSNAIFSNMAK